MGNLRRNLVGAAALASALMACSSGAPRADDPARAGTRHHRTFYVSPAGEDESRGTSPQEPWRTIDRVNEGDYGPGDRIVFAGGASFTGALRLTPENAHGRPGEPVVIGSYGEGRATIESGTATAVSAEDVGAVHVTDLVLTGGGPSHGGSGVAFTTSREQLGDIAVIDTEIAGYAYAIFVNALEAPARYEGILVDGVSAHDNALGPTFFGYLVKPAEQAERYGIVDLEVADTESYGNTGFGLPNGFGGGIAIVDAARVRIHDNVIHDNGGDNPPAPGSNGPMGIALYGGRNIVIERNEVYHQRFYPPEPTDSGGIDVWAIDALVQHNYVHDNEGWGVILGGADPGGESTWFGRDTTVRYNVIENNGRLLPRDEALPPVMGAGVLMFGTLEGYEIYNNALFARSVDGVEGDARQGLVYLVDTPPAPPWSEIHIRNNLFVAPDDVTLVDIPRPTAGDDLRVDGNAYIGGSTTRRVIWGDERYASVESWSEATGQETLDGRLRAVVTGFDALCGGGDTGTNNPRAYLPADGSPLVDAGLDLRALSDLDVGARDFLGTTVPSGPGFDIGPLERDAPAGCDR